jgi:hypothetical protein
MVIGCSSGGGFTGSKGGGKSKGGGGGSSAASADPTGQSSDAAKTNGAAVPGTDPAVDSTGAGAAPKKPNAIVIDPAAIMADYPKAYCEAVASLELRADVSAELAYFCKDGKPTADMRDLRKRLLAAPERRSVVQILKDEVDGSKDSTDFVVMWGYYIPRRPFDVKALPFYDFIASETDRGDIVMSSTASRRSDEELDSGLHLWSTDMAYTLAVQATDSITLEYSRETQYNLYQVQSGNEEMGLGIEHLTNPDEENYQKSVMLNLSFNDGEGFNDGKGETIVLNLLHITLNNRGFPKIAGRALNELANFLADSMYDGLNQ